MQTRSTTAIDRELPDIPRELWPQHPHYPSQVLLLGSHHNFRRLNRHLIEQSDLPGTSLAAQLRLYARWISAMRSHEAYEEHKLYPYLARRWGVSFDVAAAGHHALHQADRAVLEAFSTASGAEHVEPRASVVAALAHHERVLADHLEIEEDLVIPLLLELDVAEFEDYCYSPIGILLDRLDLRDRRGSIPTNVGS